MIKLSRRLAITAVLIAIVAVDGFLPGVNAVPSTSRRINVPYFGDSVSWPESAVFWFGRVDPPGAPGKNSVDVRIAYIADELSIHINVEDYYLWYDPNETLTSDLTDYDSVAIYVDTSHDRASVPQQDDYVFVSGLCLYGCAADGSRHRREGRGTGTAWDLAWTGAWSDGTWASWSIAGPNNNETGFDYGWWSYIRIPWDALGLSGPPPEGTVWGLGLVLYDRDDLPPAGAVPSQFWPEGMMPNRPDTWAEMRFGVPRYVPPIAVKKGTAVIRRGLGSSVVEDSWVGGGGTCGGGHEGDPDLDNYGDDTSLFVENQSLIADLPCFSKSFLRFDLDPIPDGKVIISATLSLHQWSNARWDEAQPSLIWLLTTDGSWSEHTLTWNNAPLAQENFSTTWVGVLNPDNSPGWPGVRYDWDATRAVAEAYASSQPLNVAMYTADTHFHSSKYFTSSETGDWNQVGRPTLTVVWGDPLLIRSRIWLPLLSRSK